jgi:hypothetical protein
MFGPGTQNLEGIEGIEKQTSRQYCRSVGYFARIRLQCRYGACSGVEVAEDGDGGASLDEDYSRGSYRGDEHQLVGPPCRKRCVRHDVSRTESGLSRLMRKGCKDVVSRYKSVLKINICEFD